MNQEQQYEEIDLTDYVLTIIKEKWTILSIFLIAIIIAGIFSFASPEIYRIETVLEIGSVKEPIESQEQITQKIEEEIYIKYPEIKAEKLEGTSFLKIGIESKDTKEALNTLKEINLLILEEHSLKFEEKISNIEKGIEMIESNLNFLKNNKVYADQGIAILQKELSNETSILNNSQKTQVIKEPTVSEFPIKPNKKLNLAIAGILGLFVGIFWAFSKNWWQEIKRRTKMFNVFEKTKFKRTLFFLISDVLFLLLSFYFAFYLRFEGDISPSYFKTIETLFLLSIVFVIPSYYFFRLYSFSWSYVSTRELISLFKATLISFALMGGVFYFFRDMNLFSQLPRSIIIISFFLMIFLAGGLRFSKRIYIETFRKNNKGKKKILIIGAEDAGEQVLRSILNFKNSPYFPIGFIDESSLKQREIVHGVKVLGKIDDIPRLIEKYEISELIISLPHKEKRDIKRAVFLARKSNIRNIKILPSVHDIIDSNFSISNIKEVEIEDLLSRESVKIDSKDIEKFIKNKIVLITGAAGSIGSELSRQTANFSPSCLILLDQDETGIFNIKEELKKRFSNVKIVSLIADIRDEEKIKNIFTKFKPQIVFHAAAYKHVPLMEEHPDEAVKNNILGTEILAITSFKNKIEKFIFVSTDKAVNPTSIMGATKRAGEIICHILNQKNSTKFVSVRFGNVLGSRGSVIPIFKEQIRRGGPIEITHPKMKRYFMTTPEACLLVMQSGAMSKGGEVFVLDMGKPVKIIDLAKEMIKLSGLEPDKDIPIVFTKTRPGEKLFEEILTAEEGVVVTQNQKIFKAKLSKVNEEKFNKELNNLRKINEKEEILNCLKRIIPFYNK